MDTADAAIAEIVATLSEPLPTNELQKVKNKMETYLTFSETNVLNRATNLAYFEMLGDAHQINNETEKYLSVTAEQIAQVASEIFRKENCNTLKYFSNSDKK
jgi:predicted Zn-dependent peptidase